MQLEVIDTSLKWQLVVDDVICSSVSAVAEEEAEPIQSEDEMICRLDKVSRRTLQNCMQDVFEDGPKRDRRLWLGDLRLQALANYETFKNYDLVKRCLYLFAGQTKDNGQVSACLFTEPKVIADDTFLLDYSMFFGATLADYYEASKDIDTLRDLSQMCLSSNGNCSRDFNEQNVIVPKEGTSGDSSTGQKDWISSVVFRAYILLCKKVKKIAEILGDEKRISQIAEEIQKKIQAAWEHLYDQEQGLFVSGEEHQINYANQVWMILAGVTEQKQAGEILDSVIELEPEKGMVSPYMNHHFVEALLQCGKKTAGDGLYEILLGRNAWTWSGYILGTL